MIEHTMRRFIFGSQEVVAWGNRENNVEHTGRAIESLFQLHKNVLDDEVEIITCPTARDTRCEKYVNTKGKKNQ